MVTPRGTEHQEKTRDGSLRRGLLVLAGTAAILSLLHFVDHAIRGELVRTTGLDPAWDHSGWPFETQSDKPYIFPIVFVVVSVLLLGGIRYTLRGRLWAGYWLATSIAINALLVFVHFIGGSPAAAETPRVITMSYHGRLPGVIALTVLFGLMAVFAALSLQAVRTRQRSGHW